MLEALRLGGAIVARDAALVATRPITLASRLLSTIVPVVGFYFVSKFVDPRHAIAIHGRSVGYFTYVSISLSFMLLQGSALQGAATTIRFDQISGTLEPILASRIVPGVYVLAAGVLSLAFATVGVALTLGVADLALGLDLGTTNVATLAVFAVLSTATMAAIGVFAAAAVILTRQMPPIAYLTGSAASLLAGTLFPVAILPWPLRAISWCLPLTHSLAGFRAAIVGVPLPEIAGDAIWLAVATIVLLPAAFVTLDAVVERGRREGTLGKF